MAHEIAKLLLEHSATFIERSQAIRAALELGMPLREVEEYLDWLDTLRARGLQVGQGAPRDVDSLADEQGPVEP